MLDAAKHRPTAPTTYNTLKAKQSKIQGNHKQ